MPIKGLTACPLCNYLFIIIIQGMHFHFYFPHYYKISY